MGLPNIRGQVVLRQRCLYARDQIASIRVIVRVLKLTPAAFWKVPTGRFLVMRTGRKRAVVKQRVARHAECHVPSA
jgi:hypothetical protein